MSSSLKLSTANGLDEESNAPKLHPRDIDWNPIGWSGNPAFLGGALYEASLYYEREGLFKALIEDGSVQLPNGKLAVPDVASIGFISGLTAHA